MQVNLESYTLGEREVQLQTFKKSVAVALQSGNVGILVMQSVSNADDEPNHIIRLSVDDARELARNLYTAANFAARGENHQPTRRIRGRF